MNGNYFGADSLPLLAAALATQLAQGRSLTELELLSAFFAVLGDDLALLAVQRANATTSQGQSCVKSE